MSIDTTAAEAKKIRSGTTFTRRGETHKVHSVVRRYETETPRYPRDPNPHPAGTVIIRHDCNCGIITDALRPGGYEIV
jgi:hypothetical protein